MTWHEPLEIYYWLVTTLSGSFDIFLILSILFLAIFAAYFRMTNFISAMMFITYMTILSIMHYTSILFSLMVVVCGYILYAILARSSD